MGELIELECVTLLDIPPDKLLQKAMGNLSEVVIIGFHVDGSRYFASSKSDAGDVFYHLERAKYALNKKIEELEAT